MGYSLPRYLILVVPPEGVVQVQKVKGVIESLNEILESCQAEFDVYENLIIATNKERNKLPRNKNMGDLEIYGTCYFIGNDKKNGDFKSLSLVEINRLLKRFYCFDKSMI